MTDQQRPRNYKGYICVLFAFCAAALFLLGESVCCAGNRVVAWGAGTFVSDPPDYNNYGQSIVPLNLTNPVYVAGGWRHSCAVTSDGRLQGWGDDTLGQIDFSQSKSNWVAVACGRLHSLALDQGVT